MIWVVNDGRYQGRGTTSFSVFGTFCCALPQSGAPKQSEVSDPGSATGLGCNASPARTDGASLSRTFPKIVSAGRRNQHARARVLHRNSRWSETYAQLLYVSLASRVQCMRKAARLVAAAKPVRCVRQTTSCDLRSR